LLKYLPGDKVLTGCELGAAGRDGDMYVYDLSGRKLGENNIPDFEFVSFSPDGKKIAARVQGSLCVYDASSLTLILPLE
jgi:hypothetical protein